MMLNRLLMVVAVSLVLAGCVLQSRAPLFSDADGELMLAAHGTTFNTYSLNKGMWEKDKDQVTFEASGTHYVVKSERSENQVLFVPLAKSWWLMQVSEVGNPTAYLLLESEAQALLLHPLECDDLKKNPVVKDAITFEGDDCFANPGTGLDLFQTLVATPGVATMKIEAAK